MNRYSIANIMVVLTIGLLLTAILIVACGPAAQTGQENTRPAENPAPTDTLAPTDTPTPYPWPTPLPTIAFTKRTGMDIQLTAASIEHENREAEAGVSGQAEPELIEVQIFLAGAQERDDIAAFLTQHGVEHSRLPYKEFDLDATIPASLLTTLAAHPSFGAMERRIPRYPNLFKGLNNLAAWYEAGLLPEEDTNPTYASLLIWIEGDENYDNVRQFLKDNGAVMGYEDADADADWKPILVAFVPVPLFSALAGQLGVRTVRTDWYPVSKEDRFTAEPTPAAPDTPAPTPTLYPTPAIIAIHQMREAVQ